MAEKWTFLNRHDCAIKVRDEQKDTTYSAVWCRIVSCFALLSYHDQKPTRNFAPSQSPAWPYTCITEDPPGTPSKVGPFFDNPEATDFALSSPGDELLYRFLVIVMLHNTSFDIPHLHLFGIES